MNSGVSRRSVLRGAGVSVAGLAFASLVRQRAAGASAARSVPQDSGVAYYVAPGGSDGNDGSQAAPFATLEAARDAIRVLKAGSGLPAGGVTVYLRGGRHERSASFALTAEDSGTADAPIVYRGYPGEAAAVVGGKSLDTDAFTPVTDPAVLARLSAGVRDRVRQVSLPALGITDYGTYQTWTYGQVFPTTPQLVFDDALLTVARWPDEGYTTTGTVTDPGTSGPHFTFEYTDPRPASWVSIEDTWMLMYPQYNWSFHAYPISSIDTTAGTITCDLASNVKEGARYYYFNVLEELDAPGEWYLDRSSGILYLYPPSDLASASVSLSQLTAPVVTLDSVQHVQMLDLRLGETRGTAVTLTDCSDIGVSACEFAFIGNWALTAAGGARIAVSGIDVHDVGTGGVSLNVGDRPTLTPGDSYVDNSQFTRYSVVNPTYSPAVALAGVGNRAAHNLIHDGPHQALTFVGNDHVVEYNEIHHVVQDSSDSGAIYNGRDWSYRGNVVRYNYLHDIDNDVAGLTKVAIYLDDMVSGVYMYGNIFENVSTGIQHCGRDNVLDNNLFLNVPLPIYVGDWGAAHAVPGGVLQQNLEKMPYQQDPWASRYPELLTILDDDPGVPKYMSMVRNAILACGAASIVPDAKANGWIMDNWVSASADVGMVALDGGYRYVPAASAVLSNVADFADTRAALVGPVDEVALLGRTQDLVAAFAGTGDVRQALQRELSAGLAGARTAVGQGRTDAAAGLLLGLAASVKAGARAGRCSVPAAQALGTLLNALIAGVSRDVFLDVSVHAEKSVVAVGDTMRLWAVGDMLSGRYVNVFPSYTLTSQTPDIAQVGTVATFATASALQTGTATVRASASDGGKQRTATLQFPVVTSLLASITLTADRHVLDAEGTLTLTVAARSTAGDPLAVDKVQFTSSDPTVATVDAAGVVTGVKEGLSVISAHASSDGITADATFPVMVGDASAPLPAGWALANLGHTMHGGTVPTEGTATYRDGTFHVMSDGYNIWADSDDCTFVYRDLGDATDLTLTATLVGGTHGSTQAGWGLLIRGGDAATAYEIGVRYQNSNALNLAYRNAAHPNSTYVLLGRPALPVQVRLSKQADVFTASYYQDGQWQDLGAAATVTVPLGSDVRAGMGIYAADAVVAEFTCSDVVIE